MVKAKFRVLVRKYTGDIRHPWTFKTTRTYTAWRTTAMFDTLYEAALYNSQQTAQHPNDQFKIAHGPNTKAIKKVYFQ